MTGRHTGELKKKPVFHGSVAVGDKFHIFLPDFKRSLIVVPRGEIWRMKSDVVGSTTTSTRKGDFDHVLLIQSLSTRCASNDPVQQFVHHSSDDSKDDHCGVGYVQAETTDLQGHDFGSGFTKKSVASCCELCNGHGRMCGGVVYRYDMQLMNCWMKDSAATSALRVVQGSATACIRQK